MSERKIPNNQSRENKKEKNQLGKYAKLLLIGYIIMIGISFLIKFIFDINHYYSLDDSVYSTLLAVSASIFGFYLATLSILINSETIRESEDAKEHQSLLAVAHIFSITIINQFFIFTVSLLSYIDVIAYSTFIDVFWSVLFLVAIIFNLFTSFIFISYILRILNTRLDNAIDQTEERIEEETKIFHSGKSGK